MIADYPRQTYLDLIDLHNLLMKQRHDYSLDGGLSFMLKRFQAENVCASLFAFDASSLDRLVDPLRLPTKQACRRAKLCICMSYQFLLCVLTG